jgi:hypothetical protein
MPRIDACLIRPQFPSPSAASLPQPGCFCTSAGFALLFRVSIKVDTAGEVGDEATQASPPEAVPPSVATGRTRRFPHSAGKSGEGYEKDEPKKAL